MKEKVIFLGQFVYNKTGTTAQTFALQVMRALGEGTVSVAPCPGGIWGLLDVKWCVRITVTKCEIRKPCSNSSS